MLTTLQHKLPAFKPDPVIEAYKQHIDRALLRENLKVTVQDRLRKLQTLQGFAVRLRRAGRLATS
jgi:hypothetical protein